MTATAPTISATDCVPTLIQVARSIPADDAGWTTIRHAFAVRASEGAGQVVGDATILVPYGERRDPDVPRVLASSIPADLMALGRYLRICTAVGEGEGTFATLGRRWQALWHGITAGLDREVAGNGGGMAQITALGLAAALEQVLLTDAWEDTPHRETPIAIGRCPDANALPAGDMSTATKVVNGQTVRVFCRAGTGTPWTAKELIKYLLAYASVGATPWTLYPIGTTLDFPLARLRLAGRSVLSVINEILNARRGWTFWLLPSSDQIFLYPVSIAPIAITVGSYTQPAALAASIDDLDGREVENLRLGDDAMATADRCRAFGACPWAGITAWWQPGSTTCPLLPDGWTYTDEVEDPEQFPDSPKWRRWKLNPDWTGTQYDGSAGLRHDLADDGAGGLTGARSWTSDTPSAAALELEARLPGGEKAWNDPTGERRAPLLLVETASGVTEDWSQAPGASIQVGNGPATVTLGSADLAVELRKALHGTTRKLYVTLGVREWAPLQVSWQRAREDWPRDTPREVDDEVEAEQWIMLAGTMLGVSSGSPVLQSGNLVVRDDLARLQASLAQLRARYGGGSTVAAFRRRGLLDTDPGNRPGRMLGTVTIDGVAEQLDSIITRRSWDFTEGGLATDYQTTRLMALIEAVK